MQNHNQQAEDTHSGACDTSTRRCFWLLHVFIDANSAAQFCRRHTMLK